MNILKKRYSHEYYLKNKNMVLERNRKWELLNKERRRLSHRDYYIKNKESIDIKHMNYHRVHRDEINKKVRSQRDTHRIYEKTWRDKNPEKILLKYKRKMNVLSSYLNKSSIKYMSVLIAWSKTVKKRDNYACQICGSNKNLNAHHILHKAKYPKLSLNINNGITLCVNHHNEVHGWK